ncbi:glycoside hydrolase family 3 N-terminal domain-containing protein [Kitasatospora viridis]|uniref:Beta-N-acetylhexosaminidase n=1 Tax=Kitasatospora viridis TaxID=281105 RepID=A0A561TTV1_9ACTN|nr:glycoside hydrolase family 3 N-terminal domain-containing protein [Kitasatospora viridis]TWF90546.1 beta-N-acetylhexosaminidase [Kitasatospora viridis]
MPSRARLRRLAGCLGLLLATGCGGPQPGRLGGNDASARAAAPAAVTAAQLARLTPDQLAGQRVIYSYKGPDPPEQLLTAIRSGRAAGVIFFGANTADPERFHAAVAALKQAQAESPVHLPLLLMTDQEGGQVRRLPGGPELSERAVGRQPDPVAAATAAGALAAENLRAAGLNVNLAPVLDVSRQDGDFIDRHERSYGQDPAQVAELGRAFIAAQQRGGVLATAKHFPGLGSTPAGSDTDAGAVTLGVSRAELGAVDEQPYPRAIAAGVRLVMVSWAVYPALDPTRPAGLSPLVVRGELRDRLGFKGVTVTDALEAGALSSYGDAGARAVAAADAGMDLLLCSAQDDTQGSDATAALSDALTTGRLDRADFTAAAQRVSALRTGLAP